MYEATWKNTANRSQSGWNAIRVLLRRYGDHGVHTELGLDNTNPNESRWSTAQRICKRFGVKNHGDLVLEILY